MSNKITEEQYREIIRTCENNSGYDNKVLSVIRVVDKFNGSLNYHEAFALVNPVTSEWAHDKFVEKEKKYRWSGKKLDVNGRHALLYKDRNEAIKPLFLYDNEEVSEEEQLIETEVKAWGYNPEMFDKEEVNG